MIRLQLSKKSSESPMIEGITFLNIEDFHYENTYKKLCPSKGGKQSKEVVFKDMWELFVWSAVLGYTHKEWKPIEKRYGSPPFRWQVIKHPHQDLLYIMAVESTGSFDILKDPEALKKNIEEHSNAGLDIMHRQMAEDKYAYSGIESMIGLLKINC